MTLKLKNLKQQTFVGVAMNYLPGYSPLSIVWLMDGPWPGFKSIAYTPAHDYAYCSNTGGTDPREMRLRPPIGYYNN